MRRSRAWIGWGVLLALLAPPIYHIWTHIEEILRTGDFLGTVQRDLVSHATWTDTLHVLVATFDFAAILFLSGWIVRLKRRLRRYEG